MPARLSAIERALKSFGITVEKPGSGSHWKAKRGSVTYTIPAHNGARSEIGDVYLKGVCRAFGIDVGEFKKLL